MDLRFTYHATVRMREKGISPQAIETWLQLPERVREGDTAIEYDGVVEGRAVRVVVVKGSQPPLVIAVHPIER